MSKDKLIHEDMYAAYCKDEVDDEGNKTCKPYSTYQRNEVAQLWEREDGSVYVTVRPKTREESEKVRREVQESIDRATANGEAIRDRIERTKWLNR